MKEFVSDLLYMCSGNNTSTRGFYILVTVVLAVLTLGIPVMLGLLIFSIVKGASVVLPLIFLLVAVAAYIGVIIWLKKS
jgi:hypothetical protein